MARQISQAKILEALEASGGNVTDAANALGYHRTALHRRISGNAKLSEAVEQIRESRLDLAETNLMKLVREGNLGAICFYLKCQGKHRGWVERSEITGADGGPVKTESVEKAKEIMAGHGYQEQE
jgi:DNA-binding Xre family transcriptional regulator